jgi:hypothetical protein
MSSISLPPDMLVEILSRLPPKSLLRFRCVSKTWLALIGNHDSKLLKDSILTTRNPTHPLPRILVKAADKSNAEKIVFYSLSYDTLDCVSQIQMILPPVPYNFIKPKCYLELVASSNGLLCLYDFRNQCRLSLEPHHIICRIQGYPAHGSLLPWVRLRPQFRRLQGG